jgi:DNA polymerase-3 subunit alpha
MAAAPYVPLRVLSAFTMLEGAIDPKAIAKHARKLGFPAVALTDRNGLYAAMPFSDACIAAGVQPIIGTLLAVARPAPADREGKPPVLDWLALYAQDERGYDNLCALVSAAHLDRPVQFDPHVALADLAGRSDGLIALTAGGEGAITRLLAEGQSAAATHYVEQLEALFPDRLYVELSRRGNDEESRAETALIELAYARDLPLVATNPACFAEADFHSAHDVMLCIANSAYVESADRPRSSADSWLKPASEMAARFADVPEAIANTLVVAQRCAVAAPSRKPILPSLAGDRDAEVAQLRDDARAGLEARLAAIGEMVAEPQVYRDRLEFELDVIVNMGFAGYFLIVADFIKWAKQNDIPVGSSASSIPSACRCRTSTSTSAKPAAAR